jgi:hypothetical protein
MSKLLLIFAGALLRIVHKPGSYQVEPAIPRLEELETD